MTVMNDNGSEQPIELIKSETKLMQIVNSDYVMKAEEIY